MDRWSANATITPDCGPYGRIANAISLSRVPSGDCGARSMMILTMRVRVSAFTHTFVATPAGDHLMSTSPVPAR